MACLAQKYLHSNAHYALSKNSANSANAANGGGKKDPLQSPVRFPAGSSFSPGEAQGPKYSPPSREGPSKIPASKRTVDQAGESVF